MLRIVVAESVPLALVRHFRPTFRVPKMLRLQIFAGEDVHVR